MSGPADSDAVIVSPLRAAGLVDNEMLERARAHQRDHGGLLSDALLRLNLLKESDFLRVFAELYSTRFVKSDKLSSLKIDDELLGLVNVRLAERLRIFPLRREAARNELHVMGALPLATDLETELRRVTGAKLVTVYVSTAAAVNAMIKRWYYRQEDAFGRLTANGAGPHEIQSSLPDEGDTVEAQSEPSAKTVMVKLDDSVTIATLRRENARYRIAQEFHRRVSLERSLQAMIDRILSVMFELLPAEGAAIALSDGTLVVRTRTPEQSVEVPRAVIDQTLASANGVVVNNALVDERFDRSKSVMIRGLQSVMAVPLRTNSRTLGVLYVESTSMSAAFTQDDLPLLESIGAQAAILLDNAELIAQVKQEVENRANLERFLSPAAVDEVLSGRMNVKLDGAAAEVTVLFADIRGFTTLSSQLRPEEVVRFLNRFFEEMVDAVEQFGGTVDKFIGDCVMALWGAPMARPDDAKNALMAALSMIDRSHRIMVEGEPLQMGIGLNTGDAVLGCIGSKRRLDYTAIGSTVNLAARLCGVAKSGEVLMTAETLMRAGAGVVVDKNDPVMVKGLEQPIVPYTLRSVGSRTESKPIRLVQVATQPTAAAAATAATMQFPVWKK